MKKKCCNQVLDNDMNFICPHFCNWKNDKENCPLNWGDSSDKEMTDNNKTIDSVWKEKLEGLSLDLGKLHYDNENSKTVDEMAKIGDKWHNILDNFVIEILSWHKEQVNKMLDSLGNENYFLTGSIALNSDYADGWNDCRNHISKTIEKLRGEEEK